MNKGEQFKIDSLEEFEQAYEMFKDEWGINFTFETEKYWFKRGVNYLRKNKFGIMHLSTKTPEFKTIPNPLKNKSMFNQELIQKLRDGEIAVKNDGSLEQLRAVLKEAFPEDNAMLSGNNSFYSKKRKSYEWWPEKWDSNMLSFSVKNFFDLDLKGFIDLPIKYVLKDKSYIDTFPEELNITVNKDTTVPYRELGILEELYKPIYKEEKPNLPIINGYKGEVLDNTCDRIVRYGCAYLDADWFKETENRSIKSLTLSSDVVIDEEEMQQIRKYLDYYDHI